MAFITSFITSTLTTLGTAIGLGAGALSTFVGVGTWLIKTAVGIGINLIAQSIAGKDPGPQFQINTTIRAGGDVPRSFIMGRTATAGSLVWVNTWGKDGDTPNAYLTQVIALSDLPCQSLDEFWVNGEKVTIDWEADDNGGVGQPVTQYEKHDRDYLWVKFFDGTQTSADEWLRTKASSGTRQWDINRVGNGICYAVVTARITKNQFSGIPSCKFVLTGMPLYDPSKDTTVGGDGDHRWNDPSTWGGDGDHFPAVQAYNIMRGIRWNSQWIYGLQDMNSNRLPAANWIHAIEKCREPILGASGLEPTYRTALEIPVDAPPANTLEALMTGCAGRIGEVGGIYRCYLGVPDTSTFSITDDDILATDEESFTPFFGLADTVNGIVATYPSPEEGWSETTAPPYYRSDLEAKHGNRRLLATVSMSYVPYPESVQRLIKAAIIEAQRERRHTITLPPAFWKFAIPGEYLNFTSARNGYASKQFRIDGAVDKANLDVVVDLTETDPDAYDFDTAEEYIPPVPGEVGPIIPPAQPIIDWAAEPASITDNDNVNRRPAILLSWDNTDGRLDDVIGIEFQVRLGVTLEVVYVGSINEPEIGSVKISQGLLPNTAYDVRGRYIPGSDRETLWSNWLPVTTPDVRITDINATLDSLGDDVRNLLQEVHLMQDYFSSRLQQLALAVSESAGVVAKESSTSVRLRDAMAVALIGQKASIEEIGGALQAVGEIDAGVLAQIGNLTAEGLWRMTAQAGVGDVVARVVLSVRATVEDDWVVAGTVWEAGFVGGDPGEPFSRVVINADQFVVTDGTETALPLVFEGGELKLSVARIAQAIVEQLESANGKLIIKGDGSNASIEIFT